LWIRPKMPSLTSAQFLVVQALRETNGWIKVYGSAHTASGIKCVRMVGKCEVETIDARVFLKLKAAGIVRRAMMKVDQGRMYRSYRQTYPRQRWVLSKEWNHAQDHDRAR
jgi:hypothetical protein